MIKFGSVSKRFFCLDQEDTEDEKINAKISAVGKRHTRGVGSLLDPCLFERHLAGN
jgi:hypothetical protein